MKNISIIFTLILIAAFTLTAIAQTSKFAGIRDFDFSNFTYQTGFSEASSKTIKLGSGKLEVGGKYEEGGSLFELFGQPAYGDLNGDKSEDAVVEIKLSMPSTYRAFEVFAYSFRNGTPKLLARLDDSAVLRDYRKYYPKAELHAAGNNPPKVSGGPVIVEALVDGSFACPARTAVLTYQLTGDKFVLFGKPLRQPFKCN